MKFPICKAACLVALVSAMPWAGTQATTGVPVGGGLGFTVQRDGDDVGTHTIVFKDSGGLLTVDVQTSVNVKLPFIGISVYHFEHKGSEVWRNGALVTLESSTDDDGEARALKVHSEGGKLHVESNVAQHESSPDLIPASLWHPNFITQRVLLNTLDGSEMPVKITEQENETIAVQGQMVTARHFLVAGGLNREVWYDSQGVLVKVAFAAKDDSRVEYVLK